MCEINFNKRLIDFNYYPQKIFYEHNIAENSVS